MTVRVYDADQVSVIIGAILVEDGYDDGEFLTIEFNEEMFNTKKGTDGSVTRSKNNDNTARMILKLMSSSPSNLALSALATTDLLAPNGAGIVPITVRDRSGSTIYTGQEAWISARPAASFDREATTREWGIEIANLIQVEGGNA